MRLKHFTTISLSLLSLLSSNLVTLPAHAQDVLRGNVNEDAIRQNESLKRNDLIKGVDPFGSAPEDQPVDQFLEPPPGSFDVNSGRPAPPKQEFKFSVSDQGQGSGNFVSQPAQQDEAPRQPPPPRQKPLISSVQTNNEPDSSAEMQLLWDAWHKRVAEAIYVRFNSLAQMAFKSSPPLACQISYAVSRDGRIGNVKILQQSPNPMYNAMLIGVVNSMTSNPLLQFPPNSQRHFVEKTGTFTWNYGNQGFKYTTNDREVVKEQRPPQGMMQGRPMQQMQQQPNQMQQMQQMLQQFQGQNNQMMR